ncbi:unnamed protein product [Mytilus edulis]|uniref:Uncharacterized protein n=1 Tax=Mytilus edulis TaxID=6550 RepID=A0A8S3RAX2_MYTED|nr:unnamed protein product [Mytilus edulis]
MLLNKFLLKNSRTVIELNSIICDFQTKSISCQAGEVIQIRSVNFGRTSTRVCRSHQSVNCYSSGRVTGQIAQACNNKDVCQLTASSQFLGEDPCQNVPKYLDIIYDCDPVPTTTTTTTTTTTPATTVKPTVKPLTGKITYYTTVKQRTGKHTYYTTVKPLTGKHTYYTTIKPLTGKHTYYTTVKPLTGKHTYYTTVKSLTGKHTYYITVKSLIGKHAYYTTVKPKVEPLTGHQVCHQYLVSGPKGVTNTQIQASTFFTNGSSHYFRADRARLHTPTIDFRNGTVLGGGWSAAINDKNQFIQVELNKVSTIRGVVTQGRNVDIVTHCCHERVTKFAVSYSIDGTKYEFIKDPQGNKQEFTGNVKDEESVVTNMLGCPIIAQYVRIHPINWLSHITMRFDLIGCPTDSDPLGKCPTGWENRPGTDDCYIITSKKTKSWMEARQDCLNNQGDLLKLDSQAEKSWLTTRLSQIQHSKFASNQLYQVWIGLNNRPRKDSSKYVWTDGTPHDLTLLPWKKGNPDNFAGSEHCGEFVNSELNDVNCFAPLPYVCEKKKYWTPPANAIYSNNNNNNNNNNVNGTGHGTSGSGCPTPGGTGSGGTGSGGTGSGGTGSGKPGGMNLPCPIGGQCLTIGNNFYTNGCGNGTDGCMHKGLGDHQSCKGCHYYLTCAPSGVFTRPCPVQLKFDDNLKACVGISSTCKGP